MTSNLQNTLRRALLPFNFLLPRQPRVKAPPGRSINAITGPVERSDERKEAKRANRRRKAKRIMTRGW